MDRWVVCNRGHVHWGAHGGAGLLLRHVDSRGSAVYLLGQRSGGVDENGTWGIPGGAIRRGEQPEEAARREAREEIAPVPSYHLTGRDDQECGGGWTFYIVRGDVEEPEPIRIRHETAATGWFTAEEMSNLPLHPRFREWFDHHRAEL
jgi:8-oxo-dGTP diphosphatase